MISDKQGEIMSLLQSTRLIFKLIYITTRHFWEGKKTCHIYLKGCGKNAASHTWADPYEPHMKTYYASFF